MSGINFVGDISKELNQLGREEMKLKLLQDIHLDMQISKVEGWDVMEYLLELKKLINDIINKQ